MLQGLFYICSDIERNPALKIKVIEHYEIYINQSQSRCRQISDQTRQIIDEEEVNKNVVMTRLEDLTHSLANWVVSIHCGHLTLVPRAVM